MFENQEKREDKKMKRNDQEDCREDQPISNLQEIYMDYTNTLRR